MGPIVSIMSSLTPPPPIVVPIPAYIVSLRDENLDGVPGNEGNVSDRAKYMLLVRPGLPDASEEDPFSYDLKESCEEAKWQKALKEETGPNGQVIILIHGFNNDAPKTVTRHVAVNGGLDKAGGNVTLVSFDWPSRKAFNYHGDQKTAEDSGAKLFLSCIEVVQNAGIAVDNISILTHSMGAYLLHTAFGQKQDKPQVSRVLMAEADVLQTNFDVADPKAESFVGSFMSWIKNDLTVYWSSDDAALAIAFTQKPRGSRLGRKGLTHATVISSYSVNNVGYSDYFEANYKKPWKGADTHIWPILGTELTQKEHGNIADPKFMADVREVVHGATCFANRDGSEGEWCFRK